MALGRFVLGVLEVFLYKDNELDGFKETLMFRSFMIGTVEGRMRCG